MGKSSTHKYLLFKSGNILSSHYCLSDLFNSHRDLFKNEDQVRNWSAGRSRGIIPRSYKLIKL